MKKNIFAATLLLIAFCTKAQHASVASGGDAFGRDGTASYSVGQVVYTTPSDYRNSNEQGVQQAYEVSEIMEKDSLLQNNLELTVYPNPTTDKLTLEIPNFNEENISYELITLTGQLLETHEINESTTALVLKNYAQGTYLLKIVNNQQPIKIFKIIKH